MITPNLHKATPETARIAWGRLSQKQRNSVVGTTFLKIIEALDAAGNASLLATLDALFGSDDQMAAHKALKTQFVNRPFEDENGNARLKLCVSRVSSKSPIEEAQVWFEVPQVLGATSPTLRTIPNEDVLDRFTESTGIDVAGRESVQLAKSEALRAAEAAQALKGSPKNNVNYGTSGIRHGIQGGTFQDGTRGYDEALGDQYYKGKPRKYDSKGKDPYNNPHSVVALPTLLRWGQNTDPTAPRLYALLGDAGTGKTSHGQQFARVLNGEVEHPDWAVANLGHNVPKALFIDLAELSGVENLAQLSLEEMLVLVLKRLDGNAVQTVADVTPLVADARAGKIIFIFDGLDELLKNDPLVLQKVFEQFLKVVERRSGSPEGQRPPKAIVSCRSHYFRDVEAQHSFFTARGRNSVSRNDYRCMTLLPWGNDLIESYLTRRVGGTEAARLMQLIATTYNLEELASRPVLLSMMAENLQAVLAERDAGLPILASTLYSKTVASWIARDNGKHSINPAHKPLLMGALAAALHNDEAEVWPADRLDQWLVRTVQALFPHHYRAYEMQGIQNDLRTATFIVRPHDSQFNFAHKSYGEYFLARFMIDGLNQVADGFWTLPLLRQYLPQHTLNIETMAFLTEMWRMDNTTQTQRTQTRRAGVLCQLLQGEDLLTTLTAAPAPALHAVLWQMIRANDLLVTDFPSKAAFNLRGLDFSAQRWHDLDTTHIPVLDLRGANLRGMYLTHCKFGAVICDEHTNASSTVFRECDTSGFAWNKAQRGGMMIRGKSISRSAGSAPLAGPWTTPIMAYPVNSAVLNLTGTVIASAGADGTVRLWDVASNAEVAVFKGQSARSVAFNTAATLLAAGGGDGLVHLWDIATKTELAALKGHVDRINHVTFNATGTLLATAGIDGTARLWDVASKAEVAVFKGHRNSANGVAFNTAGTLLATARAEDREGASLQLWNIPPKTQAATLDSNTRVQRITFKPACTLFLLADTGNNGSARLWNIATEPKLTKLKGCADLLSSVVFSVEGTLLASAVIDGTVRLWDMHSRVQLAVLEGHSQVHEIAFSANGSILASANEDGTIRLWDMTTLEASIANKQPFKPAYQIIVPMPYAPFDPSWANFDGDGNLLDWSDSAVDHWLFSQRDGRSAPIESVL
jgi:hypothetical protein